MGSSVSKSAKSYPKRAAWSGARTEPQSIPKASERKTQDIQRDAQDPHFLSNLGKLGPVTVDHQCTQPIPSTRTGPSNTVVRSRMRLEASKRSDMSAQALTDLLTRSKSSHSLSELESLVKEYGIDMETFRKISAFVNTPSINLATVRRTKHKDGVETETMTALWSESRIQA